MAKKNAPAKAGATEKGEDVTAIIASRKIYHLLARYVNCFEANQEFHTRKSISAGAGVRAE